MWYEPIYKDRREAGRALAARLSEFARRDDVIVLALPRGGVPVAYEVASALGAPLDIFVVRKLGVPGHEELAFGAIASGGITVMNQGIIRSLRVAETELQTVIRREEAELSRRESLYRTRRPPLDVSGKTAILVDDGLATGASMAAAVGALERLSPKEIVVAVPVASRQSCEELNSVTGVRFICSETPEPFYGVGMWYEDFSQTTDEEVQRIIAESQPDKGVARRKSTGQ